jgi:hypothetical protein
MSQGPSDPRVASDVAAEQARAAQQTDRLDSMTKPELLAEADARQVQVPSGATKDEILAALRGQEAVEQSATDEDEE